MTDEAMTSAETGEQWHLHAYEASGLFRWAIWSDEEQLLGITDKEVGRRIIADHRAAAAAGLLLAALREAMHGIDKSVWLDSVSAAIAAAEAL